MQDNSLHRKHCYTQTLLHTKLLPTEAFTHRSFYTQKLLPTEAFIHRSFYIQKLLHTEAFTYRSFYTQTLLHRHFYTQKPLHTGAAFTYKRLYTQKLLHIDAFTHRHLYTQTLLHKHFYTQTLLHADAFTQRSLYTQTRLHTDGFTYKDFYAETLLHTDAFTHRRFYTQALLHTITCTHRRFYTQAGPCTHSEVIVVVATSAIRRGGAAKSYFHVTRNQHPWTCHEGYVLWGPPTKVVCHLPKKKYKRADLAGGDRFWAGTHTVLQYDISWFFLGLGSWLLTVTGMETLILTLIHPSLDINSHTSIFISYLYLYLNIKHIDLSLCGSSLPIHVIHPIPGPWLHANLAAQTNNADPQSIQELWLMTVTDHIQRCPGTTICAKGIGSFIALLWSLRPFCLTHADALWWDRMHYGETERLKQRCVHQQVSDSSGWLMLMHFIFKCNCHDGVESGKEPTWPPARVGEPSYSLKQL